MGSKMKIVKESESQHCADTKRKYAILMNLLNTLKIAVDKTSEARGWIAMVFEVRRLLQSTLNLLDENTNSEVENV